MNPVTDNTDPNSILAGITVKTSTLFEIDDNSFTGTYTFYICLQLEGGYYAYSPVNSMYVACLSAGTITYTGPTSYVADAVDVSDTTVYSFNF